MAEHRGRTGLERAQSTRRKGPRRGPVGDVMKPFSNLIGSSRISWCSELAFPLLEQEVRRARLELDSGRGGDGADVHVRRDHREVRLGDARELLRLEDAAALTDIELDDPRGRLLDRVRELVPGGQAVARDDWDAGVGGDARHLVDVLGRHGFLEPERVELLEDAGDAYACLESEKNGDLIASWRAGGPSGPAAGLAFCRTRCRTKRYSPWHRRRRALRSPRRVVDVDGEEDWQKDQEGPMLIPAVCFSGCEPSACYWRSVGGVTGMTV